MDALAERRIARLFACLLDHLHTAPDGSKHATLLRCARTIGGLKHVLPYSDPQLIELIVNALPETVRDWQLARRTALAGLQHGAQSPIQLADRPYGGRS